MRANRCRKHKPITRTKCPVKFQMPLDAKTGKQKVVSFEEGHNHKLTLPEYVHLIPTCYALNDTNKLAVNSLHSFGVRSYHIMGYLVGQKRDYVRVGYMKKDLYDHIDGQRHAKIKDGDAMATLDCLCAKVDNDPLFFFFLKLYTY